MSAPQTNLEKQKRWHRGPLVGIALGLIFVGLMFLWVTGTFGREEQVQPASTSGAAPDAGSIASPVAPAPAPGAAGN